MTQVKAAFADYVSEILLLLMNQLLNFKRKIAYESTKTRNILTGFSNVISCFLSLIQSFWVCGLMVGHRKQFEEVT